MPRLKFVYVTEPAFVALLPSDLLLLSLEAEHVFMYPNQHSRGHVFSRIRPYSAVFTAFFSVVLTRCSEHTAQDRIPALMLLYIYA